MAKSRAKTLLGDLTRRGLVARNCGARMYKAGMDWVTAQAIGYEGMRPELTDDELDAYQALSESSWMNQWWRGWNDAGARDLEGD